MVERENAEQRYTVREREEREGEREEGQREGQREKRGERERERERESQREKRGERELIECLQSLCDSQIELCQTAHTMHCNR